MTTSSAMNNNRQQHRRLNETMQRFMIIMILTITLRITSGLKSIPSPPSSSLQLSNLNYNRPLAAAAAATIARRRITRGGRQLFMTKLSNYQIKNKKQSNIRSAISKLSMVAFPIRGGDSFDMERDNNNNNNNNNNNINPVEKIVTNAKHIISDTTSSLSSKSTSMTDDDDDDDDVPNVKSILKFAIPAIGVWLCNPFLCMIDTSAVGLFSGTEQQAALNPAVAVSEYAFMLMAFMNTGTTNLISSSLSSDSSSSSSHTNSHPLTTTTLLTALRTSLTIGTILSLSLLLFSHPLLLAMLGSKSNKNAALLSPLVVSSALRYIRIRALGMPAAVFVNTAQAACLGMKDLRSPLRVLVVGALVNLVGDLVLVRMGGGSAWVGGAAGAAWAKVVAQYASMGLFAWWLGSDVVDVEREKKKNRPPPLARGFLSKRQRRASSLSSDASSSSSETTSRKLWSFFLPVTTSQIGRLSTYITMAHVVSSSIGTIGMAAQQIVLSLFYCLTPISDALGGTAQSFVPRIIAAREEEGREREGAMRKVTMNFLTAGGIFGVFMTMLVAGIPLISRWFTMDGMVLGSIRECVPWLLGTFILHGIFCATEGVLVGQRDLKFIGRIYSCYFLLGPWLMLRVKSAALAGSQNVGLKSVWQVYFGFQILRTSVWLMRVLYLSRQKTKEKEPMLEPAFEAL